MCAYRSLFSMIDFKLKQKSLKEIGRMDFDIVADTQEDKDKAQQVASDINDYKDDFADGYCRNLRQDFEAQIAFIERLEKKSEESTDLKTFIKSCE